MSTSVRVERARTVSVEERRSTIIKAALKIFDRHGFDAAKVSDIAAEAKIAKGTVYIYFKSKDELLEGVIHAVMGPSIKMISDAVAQPKGNAFDLIKLQIEIISDLVGKKDMRSILRLMIAGGQRFDQSRRYYYDNCIVPGMNAIRRTLEYGENRGDFRPGVSAMPPQLIAGPSLLAALWKILFENYEPLDVRALLTAQFSQLSISLAPDR